MLHTLKRGMRQKRFQKIEKIVTVSDPTPLSKLSENLEEN